jgi:hypothetical protein
MRYLGLARLKCRSKWFIGRRSFAALDDRPDAGRFVHHLEIQAWRAGEFASQTFDRVDAHLRRAFGAPARSGEYQSEWILPPIIISHAVGDQHGERHWMGIEFTGRSEGKF